MDSPSFPISAIDEPLAVRGRWFAAGDERVWIKAVTFGPFPAGHFADEGISQLERLKNDLGANALRLYEIPSFDFLHACAELGLRVFVTLPWSQHVDFQKDRGPFAAADQLLLETVQRFRGHPAIAGYLVGNEIDATLVRWMRPRRVRADLEHLIEVGRANDPDALFAYANYPSTEYLLPRNQDFLAFNLYLEDRKAYRDYLARLQCWAGDKPLLITEFGCDSNSHGEEAQAEMHQWQIDEAQRAGVAGTTLFAWSDLWQRGGQTIEGWNFGLTRRDSSPKPALTWVAETWSDIESPADGLDLGEAPKVSVIVCTYRGSATLVACLDSLVAIDYPDFEVIVVNDGKDLRVAEIAETYPPVRHIAIDHSGLSFARNIGAEAARGAIFAYTDDDCVVERDWLKWLVSMYQENPSLGAGGGPNIPPPAETAQVARIAAAPGSATHVLLSDRLAEHIPGCNLSVKREAFEAIGGFDPIYRAAGDDVDFCWRLLEADYEIGFQASAFVWHHRRLTVAAYLRQQRGYGKAEALLMPNHLDRFRSFGGAEWHGRVYSSRPLGGELIYHGLRGYAPFQLIYPAGESGLGELFLNISWLVVGLGFAVLGGLLWWPLLVVAGLMALATLVEGWRRAGRAPIEGRYEGFTSKLVIGGLIHAQGIVRSASRIRHGWRWITWGRHARKAIFAIGRELSSGWWKIGGDSAWWSDQGVGRDALLDAIKEREKSARDDDSGKTDLELGRDAFWSWALLTVTEYHEGEGRLTRVRLLGRPHLWTRVALLFVIPLVLIVLMMLAHYWIAAVIVPLSVLGHFLIKAAIRLRRRNIDAAAKAIGLKPM
ncbi:MAG: glycosyltransferase [Verrucomicrobiota bacterium]